MKREAEIVEFADVEPRSAQVIRQRPRTLCGRQRLEPARQIEPRHRSAHVEQLTVVRRCLAPAEHHRQRGKAHAARIGFEAEGPGCQGSEGHSPLRPAARRPLDVEPGRQGGVSTLVERGRQAQLETHQIAADAQAAFAVGFGRDFESRAPIGLPAEVQGRRQLERRAQGLAAQRAAKIELRAGQGAAARRARLHLKAAAEEPAAHIGARHLRSFNIEIAVQVGRRRRRRRAGPL